MPGPHMTAKEVADDIGRSLSWLYSNWQDECQRKDMPLPMHAHGVLVWDRAQFYAWKDRDLKPDLRTAAMAYRAAAAAAAKTAHVSNDTTEIDRSRAALNAKLGIAS